MAPARLAQADDLTALQLLIAQSAAALVAGHDSAAQTEAITRHVFGVDSQRIEVGTYLVVESDGRIVACGGWSRRRSLYGCDHTRTGPHPLLDPATEPARIRAFFVDPAWARRGLGHMLLEACTAAARSAVSTSLELVATLPMEPLYAASQSTVVERFERSLPDAIRGPVCTMRKLLQRAPGDALQGNPARSSSDSTIACVSPSTQTHHRTGPASLLNCPARIS